MADYGIVVNDISGLGRTSAQIGGTGVAYWKMLMNGTHLVGPWNCVEFVVLTPGASVGEHVHLRTEEIYYIISGDPIMRINGIERSCRPGDVITAPIGTRHGIRNDGTGEVEFFVVEVFPGEGASAPVVQANLEHDGADRLALADKLSGGWQYVERVEVAPGKSGEFGVSDESEVLFMIDGAGEISVGDDCFPAEKGFAVASPPKIARSVRAHGRVPLHLLRLAVNG